MTPSELLRLGSLMVAISHSLDKIMLIARVVIDDTYEDRESRFTNLKAIDGTNRNISGDETR